MVKKFFEGSYKISLQGSVSTIFYESKKSIQETIVRKALREVLKSTIFSQVLVKTCGFYCFPKWILVVFPCRIISQSAGFEHQLLWRRKQEQKRKGLKTAICTHVTEEKDRVAMRIHYSWGKIHRAQWRFIVNGWFCGNPGGSAGFHFLHDNFPPFLWEDPILSQLYAQFAYTFPKCVTQPLTLKIG